MGSVEIFFLLNFIIFNVVFESFIHIYNVSCSYPTRDFLLLATSHLDPTSNTSPFQHHVLFPKKPFFIAHRIQLLMLLCLGLWDHLLWHGQSTSSHSSRNNESPSPSSHQLTRVPQRGTGTQNLFSYPSWNFDWLDLVLWADVCNSHIRSRWHHFTALLPIPSHFHPPSSAMLNLEDYLGMEY